MEEGEEVGQSRLRKVLLLAPPALITVAVIALIVFNTITGAIADRAAEDKAEEVEARMVRTGLTFEQVQDAIFASRLDPAAAAPEQLVLVEGTEPYGYGSEPERITIRLRSDTFVPRCIRVVVPRRGSPGATAEDC